MQIPRPQAHAQICVVRRSSLIVAVVAMNQVLAIVAALARHHTPGGVLGIGPVANSGSALGFAQGNPIWILVALFGVIAAIAITCAAPTTAAGVALMSGGAAANTLQRLTLHGVTDYIQVGTTQLGLAFNLADVALIVGAALTTRALLPHPTSRPTRERR
jgi:lipoprotein signal peptidase